MSTTLDKNQLVDIRDALLDLIAQSLKRRDRLENQSKISKQVSESIGKYEEILRDIANNLDSVILSRVIADIDNPGQRIIAVTKDVEKAIDNLSSLNDYLRVLASVLSMATTILTAFTTGNSLGLINILTQIENLI